MTILLSKDKRFMKKEDYLLMTFLAVYETVMVMDDFRDEWTEDHHNDYERYLKQLQIVTSSVIENKKITPTEDEQKSIDSAVRFLEGKKRMFEI